MMVTIIAAIATPLCTALCGYVVYLLQDLRKEKKERNQTYQILLRAEIRQLHAKYTQRGYISAEELGEAQDIYDTYHKLGGNGRATVMMDDLKKLERRE